MTSGKAPIGGNPARGRELKLPEDIPRAFVDAWNARDADGIASLFSEDADFVNVVGIWWEDRESIRRAHAYGLDRIFSDSTIRLGRVKVRRVTGEVAVVHARMRLMRQSGTGEVASPGERTTLFSFVLRRAAGDTGGWTCVSAHNTDVVPGAETHVRDEASGVLRAADYRS